MGMKQLKCPSCGADLNLDDSKEYGFCSYCGTKVQINDRINVHVTHEQAKEGPKELLQKARICMSSATIDNDKVMEGLFWGQQALERLPAENRQKAADLLAQMYMSCMAKLGNEMVATIKTYNNTERNSIAVRQTHNVLKSMVDAPNYFRDCSPAIIEQLKTSSVKIYRSLTGWAKQAAKIYNHNRAYCANLQNMSNQMQTTRAANPDNPQDTQPTKSKPWYKRWWLWVIIGVVVIGLISIIAGGGGSKSGRESNNQTQQNVINDNETAAETETTTQPTTEDLSQIETVYELGNGNYTAGIDLPIGKCNVYAVSGTGNVSSSNMFSGGMNEMFGIDEGEGWYTDSFNGLSMDKDVVLTVSGGVTIRLEYTDVKKGYSGRTYAEEEGFELSGGNYIAGEDFPAGTYRITASYGTGNLYSTNIFNGGVNEMFGIDDGMGWYTDRIDNVELPDGEELQISGGLGVWMVPAHIN